MDKLNTASTDARMIERFLRCSFRPTHSTYVFLRGVHLVWGGGGDAAARLPRPGPEPSGRGGKGGRGRREEGVEPGPGRCVSSGAREEARGRREGERERETG